MTKCQSGSLRTPPLFIGDKMEEQKGQQRQPSGNISNYNSIEEKEEKCKEMVGYNESLTVGSYIEKTKKIGEKK